MKHLNARHLAAVAYAVDILGLTDAEARKYADKDRDAFLWHVMSVTMTDADRERVEAIAEQLLAGGYENPQV
jgi:hypothetical protein